MNRIGVQLVVSRPDYLGVLLSSLLRQTLRKWDLILVFQDSKVIDNPLITPLLHRMSYEGHRIRPINAEKIKGIGALRNVALEHDDCKYGIRIDDDSWCEPDYFEKIYTVLEKEKQAGCVGGIVPNMVGEKIYRPFENLGWMNEFGDLDETFTTNFYNTFSNDYIPISNLRSSFMYHNSRAKEIGGYPTEYDEFAGFREETDFCLRMGQKYQNYFVPQAVCWHLSAPSGGTRGAWTKHGLNARHQADTLFRRKFYPCKKCFI